ncbi:MAG: DUF1360 domain-containing protein [Nocardioidaceae bacterium]|nr:DUF1360 domain-containing protein [Nocardioidaceae bacterium]
MTWLSLPARTSREDEDLMEVAYDFLATYRLTTLIKDDKLREDFRGLVFQRFGEPGGEDGHKVSYLVTCPWCLSIYFAAVAVVARKKWPRAWGPVAKALTFSAMTGLLAEKRAELAKPDEPVEEQS